jgi:hypothetical protein
MADDKKDPNQNTQIKKVIYKNGSSGAVYGLGLIGALFYYLSHAASFTTGVLGILKAILWPAFLVYQLLQYLKM